MSVRDSLDFTGKVAVVTGAGAGIGRGVAERFAECGARIAALDLNLGDAQAVAKKIQSAGGECVAIQADVGVPESVDSAFGAIGKQFGTVDFMLNIAGAELYKNLLAYSTEEWTRQIAVNLDSVYYCSRRAIPYMVKAGQGSIIMTASIQAYAASGEHAPYAAAKGAMVAMAKDMARDFGPQGIRVNAIAPGCIDTPMLSRSFPPDEVETYKRRLAQGLPLGRVGLPADIANMAIFLCSPLASYVTGVTVLVDGGMMCKLPITVSATE